jgi:hypothetical protein
MRTLAAWLAAAGFVLAARAEPPPKPEALARAEASRSLSSLFTARLEISVREPHPDPNQPPTRRFFTWRCAGAEHLVVHHGNEDGEVMPWFDFDGTPIRSPEVYEPRHYLFLDGRVWLNTARELRAEVRPGEARSSYDLFDWRQVGLNPVSLDRSWDATVQESIEQGAPPPEYSVRVEEGLQIVTARALESEVTWWIDPQRGWNVVRTAFAHAGKPMSEQRITLREFDGRWFPACVEEVSPAAGESEPRRVWEVLYAEFNRPSHPQELGPADIGVEPGRPVRVYERQDALPQRAYWDGLNLVSADEFAQRVRAGERFEGPARVRERARNAARIERLEQLAERGLIEPSALPPPLAARFGTRLARSVRSFETAWEKYTREFIRRHSLDNDQIQKAWSICRECQELAREYVSRKRADLEKLEKRLADQPASPASQPAADAAEKELADLLRPVEGIFEERLKARLDALLTREQRQRASDADKSRTVP